MSFHSLDSKLDGKCTLLSNLYYQHYAIPRYKNATKTTAFYFEYHNVWNVKLMLTKINIDWFHDGDSVEPEKINYRVNKRFFSDPD